MIFRQMSKISNLHNYSRMRLTISD